ncbi:MAG: YhfC family intramembrane metalloprotease [Thermoflexales bacterium]|nr:YhfC family intramembrane metalloprotease [Thermoflexales bacterium]
MLYVTFPLAALVELLAPAALAAWLAWRLPVRPGQRGANWLLVGVGVLTFIGSQVVHLPLNWGLGQLGLIVQDESLLLRTAIVLGLSAGLCEETARAAGYWLLKRQARTWRAALTLGAGHGGIESIIVGGLVLLGFVNMLVLRDMDLSTLKLPAEQLELLQSQMSAYWQMAWHMPFTGAVERLIAITLHLSLSVLVLQAFTRRNALYYLAAVAWHAAVNTLAVMLSGNRWEAWAIEGVLALTVLISLGIILAFRRSPHDQEPVEALATPPAAPPVEIQARGELDVEAMREQIDKSKFDM